MLRELDSIDRAMSPRGGSIEGFPYRPASANREVAEGPWGMGRGRRNPCPGRSEGRDHDRSGHGARVGGAPPALGPRPEPLARRHGHLPGRAAGRRRVRRRLPRHRRHARGSRAVLRRTITHRGREAGVRQFLDVGTGLPTAGNTHEVAQRLAPESRIVYVGDDPMLPAPARTLLRSSPGARPPASTPTPPTRTASSPPPRRRWTRPGRPGSSPATSWAMSPATTRPAPSSTG